MGMLLQEVRGLKRNIAAVLKRFAIKKAMAADESWRRPKFEKEQPMAELAADAEETSKTGTWISAKVVRWFEEKGYGFIKANGVDVFAHSTSVKGTTMGIIGAAVFIKVIEDMARQEGKYKAVEVKREHDYLEDLAQQKLEEATAGAVKAADESKRRAMEAHRAMEVQQAAAPWANVSRLPGLTEPIRPTTNKFAFSRRALETREVDTVCVEVELMDEQEDTPLVR